MNASVLNDVVERDATIDTLRGVSILLVLFHHFSLVYNLQNTWLTDIFGWSFIKAASRNGNYGVTIFFLVSGYLITTRSMYRWGALKNIKLLSFYRFRAARIIPCIVLLLLIVDVSAWAGLSVFQNHSEYGPDVSFGLTNIASLTFLINILMSKSGWFNYVLCVQWSLCIEEAFYVIFPLLCVILRKKFLIYIPLVSLIILGPIWRLTHQDTEYGYLFSYASCLDGIAFGVLAALLEPYYRPGKKQIKSALMYSSAFLLTLFYLYKWIGCTNIAGVTIVAFLSAVLILNRPLMRGNAGFASVFSHIRYNGRLSYELYLFHLVVLAYMQTVLPPESQSKISIVLLFFSYFVISAICAHIINKTFSDPFNRWFRAVRA